MDNCLNLLKEERLNNYDVYFPPAEHWLVSSSAFNGSLNGFLYKTHIKRVDSLYIHFPFCPARCRACPYIKLDNRYLREVSELIIKEINLYGRLTQKKTEIKSIHFGGGTPNFIPPHIFNELLIKINENFNLSYINQVAIEIRPGVEYKKHIKLLLKHFKAKYIHISLGLQSASPRLIKFYKKPISKEKALYYTKEDVEEMIRFCHKMGIKDINVDFMTRNFNDLKKESKYIKLLIEKFRINKLTIYPLFTKFMERRNFETFKKWTFKEIKNIRKYTLEFFRNLHFKPIIWPNYFIKDGTKPNLESWTQFQGSTLIAVGPSARGVIRTKDTFLFYENARGYDAYNKKINQNFLSAEKIYSYPTKIPRRLSDDLRGIFINQNRGLSFKNINVLKKLARNGKNEQRLLKIIKCYFVQKNKNFFLNKNGFYFVEAVYWAIWDCIKETFKKL